MTVFVWVESFDGRAVTSSWEALGAANTIAEALDTDTTAVVLGENAEDTAKEAGTLRRRQCPGMQRRRPGGISAWRLTPPS